MSVPVSKIEIGPGANPRKDWMGRDDVLYVEEGEWRKLVDTPAGSVEEVYIANVCSSREKFVTRKLGGMIFRVPMPVAYDYFEMVRWAAALERALKPGGIVTVMDDNTPVENPDMDIIEPFTEQGRFVLVDREAVDTSPWPVPGYKLVFQKPG